MATISITVLSVLSCPPHSNEEGRERVRQENLPMFPMVLPQQESLRWKVTQACFQDLCQKADFVFISFPILSSNWAKHMLPIGTVT